MTKPERGSFQWYKSIDDKFFIYLTKAIMHADTFTNMRKIKKIFPHICIAHELDDWEKAPQTYYPITVNIEKPFEEEKDGCNSTTEGTFSKYLHNDGHFISYFSNAIANADRHNLKLISFQYPQMVAAHNMPMWNMCPYGFVWNGYNSPRQMYENSEQS